MASEEIVSLRNESMAAQQQRLELARFKIISVAVLGSLAIGASGLTEGSVPYIIGLVPLVAIYIDVISETKKIQFMAIGAFLNTLSADSVMGKYEDFVNSHRSAFLRNYSYQYSTIIVSAAIALMGVGRLLAHQINADYVPDPTLVAIEISTGVVGVILSVLLNATVASRIKRFNAVENES